MIRNCLTSLFLLAGAAHAQQGRHLEAGLLLPVSSFSATHLAGVDLSFRYSHNRSALVEKTPQKRWSWTAEGGLSLFTGTTERVVDNRYRYKSYGIIRGYAGTDYRLSKRIRWLLQTGPALSRYAGSWRFNWGASLRGIVALERRWYLSPGWDMLMETGADPLWWGGLRVGRNF